MKNILLKLVLPCSLALASSASFGNYMVGSTDVGDLDAFKTRSQGLRRGLG